MNMIIFFSAQVILTLVIVSLIVGYLRPHLKMVLVDLCGTEGRAQFWTVFSNVLLIGMPLIFSLNYRPEASNAEELFFDVASKLSGNLGGLLIAMIGIGVIVSFFALVAPKGSKVEAK
jgi:hypothetical protein